MSGWVFVGDQRIDSMPADDRGIAYGDGLFETMRVHAGLVPWWEAHWARLQRGARRLRMGLPDEVQVCREAAALFADQADYGVLKLIVTRGSGGRGYAPTNAPPNWMLSPHPLPRQPSPEGLSLRWCGTRLAIQPALAGIKHCNRLEQVLARAELNDPAASHPAASGRHADEGLMCSSEGDVVCAIAANLFVLRDKRWLTPKVDRCGVAGICRGQLLPLLDAHEARLSVADIETAETIFLCNAVRGILGVARLGTRTWLPHPAVAEARGLLARTHPGFSIDAEIS